ncbi:putative uncharacterized protein [Firmicutes bacterium CAG:631]|nr:putative uncharacterized protein [Firmicutes bacterium CAG:631]
MVIKVSTYFFNSSIPDKALLIRTLPSKVKGRVTMPITKAPHSLATLATTGAAPVPVPPPIPAAMKTISVSLTISRISSSLSKAACSPTAGLAPAPNPFVVVFPKTTRFSAFEQFNTWASVFKT